MLIKPRSRLTARDLPFVESPYLAARRVKQALDSGPSPELRFDPGDIPGLPIYSGPDATRTRLVSALEAGQLMLVLDPGTSSGPINPPVSWCPKSPISAGGRWGPDCASMPFPFLSQELDRLNRLGETPESLASSVGVGLSPTQAGQGAGAMGAKEASGPTDRKLSLPLGAAAGIAPLAEPAPQASRNQADDTDLPVHLTIGIFMDGTLNNYENIGLFKQRLENECIEPLRQDPEQLEGCRERLRLLMGESYANGPTNVSKLWRLYGERKQTFSTHRSISFSVYAPGPGTRTGNEDSVVGMATGLGETGVIAQVEEALSEVAFRSADLSKGKEIRRLTFDLFGFSRGAAAARHVANDIHKGMSGFFGRMCQKHGVEMPSAVSVRFVGLFDTVAGIVNLLELDRSAGNHRNAPVDLYLDPALIDKAVHLVAKDEKRKNFSLNSLRGKSGELPANFREIELPGAHSDIGGGYLNSQTEDVLLHPKLMVTGSAVKWVEETFEWDSLLEVKRKKDSEHWIGENSLVLPDGSQPEILIERIRDDHPMPDGRVELRLRMKRQIKGEYSRVPLRIMHRLAIDAGLPMKAIPADRDFSLPADLERICENLNGQISSGVNSPSIPPQWSQFLKQRYIHHSDHFNVLEFLAWDQVMKLEIPFRSLIPSVPRGTGERLIHENAILE